MKSVIPLTLRSFHLPGFSLSLIIFVAISSVACRHNEEQKSRVDGIGSYSLISVNGSRLPATVEHHGTPIYIASGELFIERDSSCTSTTIFGPPGGSPITRTVKAVYKQRGKNLTLRWENGGQTSGSIEGITFTMNNEGMEFFYEKQANPAPVPAVVP